MTHSTIPTLFTLFNLTYRHSNSTIIAIIFWLSSEVSLEESSKHDYRKSGDSHYISGPLMTESRYNENNS